MVRTPRLIKVCLCNLGEDAETPWAADLGPARGPRGSRRVRLVNVPFMHAKPTWGDEIVVSPVEDGMLTWDAGGVQWSRIGTRIAKDGGRYAMIVDYKPRRDDPEGDRAYAALHAACETAPDLTSSPIVCEGAFGPRPRRPGRVYLAVEKKLRPAAVMKRLDEAGLPCALIQVHPTPRKKSVGRKKLARRARSRK